MDKATCLAPGSDKIHYKSPRHFFFIQLTLAGVFPVAQNMGVIHNESPMFRAGLKEIAKARQRYTDFRAGGDFSKFISDYISNSLPDEIERGDGKSSLVLQFTPEL